MRFSTPPIIAILWRWFQRWYKRLTIALGTLFLLVTFTPVTFWWATVLSGPWTYSRGDVLIVLTGSDLEDGVIGYSSYWRAVYALRFYRDEGFQEIIITGGGGQAIPSAESIRNFIVAQGVPAGVVQVEGASDSTQESAENTGKLLASNPGRYQNRRLVLLTSDYHMYRSHKVFEQAGVFVEPRPIPDIRKRYSFLMDRWGLFLELMLENVKIGYYWSQGWI